MTIAEDTSTLPQLDIRAPGEAVIALPGASEEVLSALMIRALKAHAVSVAGDGARTVSVSLDMTGATFSGGEAVFSSAIDRQTRTLVFIGGELVSGGDTLMKATAIFRTESGNAG